MSRFRVRHYVELTSTMDEASKLARDHAPDGTVVVAARQSQGRGRHGRTWFSPAGNLFASILLRPGLPPARLTELGFVVALAVADAVDTLLPVSRAKLKWPNDVLVDGAKIAGILVEVIEDNAAVIGIGVNVEQTPEATPYPATSLRDAGAPTSAEAVLAQLLPALEQHLALWQAQGFARTRADWLARGPAPGDLVRIRTGVRIDTGRFAGLDADGALLLAEAGSTRRVVAGDVVRG